MKKISISLLAFGLITLLLGIIANQSVIENFSIRAIKQISFTAILFGGSCTIYGVLGFAFSKQMSKVCSLRTTALSCAVSAITSLGIHCVLSFLSCYFLTNPTRHPIRHPASLILGFICLAIFVLLLNVYYNLRKNNKTKIGFFVDCVTCLTFMPSIYFIIVVTDNLIGHII